MSKEDIKKITAKIARDYQPEKIILFGSFAWGKPNKNSDIDLFIIKKTTDTRKTTREIDGSFFPRDFAMDIMVCTPEQAKNRLKIGDSFITKIFNEGKILYDRG